jgi:hypothetical protein
MPKTVKPKLSITALDLTLQAREYEALQKMESTYVRPPPYLNQGEMLVLYRKFQHRLKRTSPEKVFRKMMKTEKECFELAYLGFWYVYQSLPHNTIQTEVLE